MTRIGEPIRRREYEPIEVPVPAAPEPEPEPVPEPAVTCRS